MKRLSGWDVLMLASEGIEQAGLAGIRVAGESDTQVNIDRFVRDAAKPPAAATHHAEAMISASAMVGTTIRH